MTNERQFKLRGRQRTLPLVKNLSAPPQNPCQPLGIIIGSSCSPSKLTSTLEYLPLTESSSNESSTVPSLSPLSPSLPHFPTRGRSPTKYTRRPGTSEIRAVRSSRAGVRAILSSPVRTVIGPRKQRGRETYIAIVGA